MTSSIRDFSPDATATEGPQAGPAAPTLTRAQASLLDTVRARPGIRLGELLRHRDVRGVREDLDTLRRLDLISRDRRDGVWTYWPVTAPTPP